MGGGAWPFLVGGAICLVNSDNERDSGLLNSDGVIRRGARAPRAECGRWGNHGGGGWSVAFGGQTSCAVDLSPPSPSSLPRRVPSVFFLEVFAAFSRMRESNNRSVMPLDVLGRTRATLEGSACQSFPGRKVRATAEPPPWLGLGTAKSP